MIRPCPSPCLSPALLLPLHFLPPCRYQALHFAVIKMQSLFRRHQALAERERRRIAVVMMQSAARRLLARLLFARMLRAVSNWQGS